MAGSMLAVLAIAVGGGGTSPFAVVMDHACGSFEPSGDERISIAAAGTTAVVLHREVVYNCGLELGVAVALEGDDLWLRELQLGRDERCVCLFSELRYEIHDLAPGSYKVHVVKIDEEEPFWSGELLIRAGKPELAAALRKSPTWRHGVEDRIDIVPDGRAIRIEHRDATIQCCAILSAALAFEGRRVRIRAEDIGPPCDCIGGFDLWFLAGDLAPGLYGVLYVDVAGRKTEKEIEVTGAVEGAFVRGEANGDGRVDLADAIFVLLYLFASGWPPACIEAADINDDAAIDLGDPIGLLNYLFASGPPPSPPFPGPGLDPTPDALGCELSSP